MKVIDTIKQGLANFCLKDQLVNILDLWDIYLGHLLSSALILQK